MRGKVGRGRHLFSPLPLLVETTSTAGLFHVVVETTHHASDGGFAFRLIMHVKGRNKLIGQRMRVTNCGLQSLERLGLNKNGAANSLMTRRGAINTNQSGLARNLVVSPL